MTDPIITTQLVLDRMAAISVKSRKDAPAGWVELVDAFHDLLARNRGAVVSAVALWLGTDNIGARGTALALIRYFQLAELEPNVAELRASVAAADYRSPAARGDATADQLSAIQRHELAEIDRTAASLKLGSDHTPGQG